MIFAIIFTIIIMGSILALGFTQIQGFLCIGSNAQTVKSFQDITALTNEVFLLSTGSVKTYRLGISGDATMCFINEDDPSPHPYENARRTWNPNPLVLENFLLDPISQYFGSNVWIYSCDNREIGEGHEIQFLSPSQSFCARGGDTLFIENKGASVDISFR